MILDAKCGKRGVLVDGETGKRIPFARWANTETGEYEAFAATPDGCYMLKPARVIRGRVRCLRFVEEAPPVQQAAPIARRPCIVAGHRECEEPNCHRLAVWQTSDELLLEPVMDAARRRVERAKTVAVHYYCDLHWRPPTVTSQRGVVSVIDNVARPT